MANTLAIPTNGAARKIVGGAQEPTAEDESIAAEWDLNLRRVCTTPTGSVTGIYSGRFKLADYCHDSRRLMIGNEQSRCDVESLFDAIMLVVNLAATENHRMPSWLHP